MKKPEIFAQFSRRSPAQVISDHVGRTASAIFYGSKRTDVNDGTAFLHNPEMIGRIFDAASKGDFVDPEGKSSMCLIFNDVNFGDGDSRETLECALEAVFNALQCKGSLRGGSALEEKDGRGLSLYIDVDGGIEETSARFLAEDDDFRKVLSSAGVSSFRIGAHGGEFTPHGFSLWCQPVGPGPVIYPQAGRC